MEGSVELAARDAAELHQAGGRRGGRLPAATSLGPSRSRSRAAASARTRAGHAPASPARKSGVSSSTSSSSFSGSPVRRSASSTSSESPPRPRAPGTVRLGIPESRRRGSGSSSGASRGVGRLLEGEAPSTGGSSTGGSTGGSSAGGSSARGLGGRQLGSRPDRARRAAAGSATPPERARRAGARPGLRERRFLERRFVDRGLGALLGDRRGRVCDRRCFRTQLLPPAEHRRAHRRRAPCPRLGPATRRGFRMLGLLRDFAPSRSQRLVLLALDFLLGHSVLALQLEMLPDGIVEYAHLAEPYRGREDGSAATADARCTRFLPARFAS